MPTTERTLKQFLDLELQYWQAIKDRDSKTAMQLSDDPCIVAGASGVMRLERAQLEAMPANATYTLNSFELSDPQVHLVHDDTAIVAYKVHEELVVDGKPVTLDAADASTWVRKYGRWVCTLHTEAISGDAFGRDRRSAL